MLLTFIYVGRPTYFFVAMSFIEGNCRDHTRGIIRGYGGQSGKATPSRPAEGEK
jgi:hypothetical protein